MLGYSGRTMRVCHMVTLIAATIGAVLAIAGCSSNPSTGSTGLFPNGSLTVTVTAPPGVTPEVTVTGPRPGGRDRVVVATTTLTRLAVGNYAVVATTVATTDPIISTVDTATVSGSPATVTANDTAKATVSYTPQAGTGGLWVANSASAQTVTRFTAAQLAGTDVAPTPSLGTGDPRPFGVAFDFTGNLWVALSQGNLVVEYAVSQLSLTDLAATPAVTLGANAGSLSQPAGLAFDSFGNLWVANGTANTVVEFSAGQLHPGVAAAQANGSPAPAVTIGASAGSLNAPLAVAFDFSGDLWVANANAGTVVEFSAAQLAASGTPTPAVTLSAAAGSIVGPIGLAFDASGNLWVANGSTGHNTVVEFAASQLTASGAPTPRVVLSASAGSLASPTGLTFDNSGDLWVANATSPTVVEFTSSQLASSGSPTPNIVVRTRANSLGMPVGLAFDPPGLPVLPPDPWDP